MRRHALVLSVLALVGCGPFDPCKGQSGACVAIDLQGKVTDIDSVSLSLSGAVTHAFVDAVAGGHGSLPIAVGVLVPDTATGTLLVTATATRSGSTLGRGSAMVDLVPGRHVRVVVPLTAYAPSCANGVFNPGETDVDCGGSCSPCPDGAGCLLPSDCLSAVCAQSQCAAPTCSDGIFNQLETDADCGGPCAPCAGGRMCLVAADCQSMQCMQNLCTTPVNQPSIAGISPGQGPSTGDTVVTLSGANFVAGTPLAVSFDGLAATSVAVTSPTTIVATTPRKLGARGPATVVLTNGDGQQVTDTTHFRWFAGQVDFAAARIFDTTGYANNVVLADVNGDGHLDALVAERDAAKWGVMIGAGDQTFGPLTSFGSCNDPRSIATGDFDADGKIDVAVACAADNAVKVYKGAGDGSFPSAWTLSGLSAPGSVAAGDFDGQKGADLAVAESGAARVQVFLNSGNAIQPFSANTPFALPHPAVELAIGKIDAGTTLDLVVTNHDASNHLVSVLRGVGDGTFMASQDYATDQGPTGVRIGDFNGDGRDDVLVGCACAGTCANPALQDLMVLLNQNIVDGSLNSASAVLTAGLVPSGFTVGDFNEDGKLDVVLHPSSTYTFVYAGQGTGGFTPLAVLPSYKPTAAAAGDLDQDGHLNLVVTEPDYNGLTVVHGMGLAGFRSVPSYAAGPGPGALVLADLTGDARIDLLTATKVNNTMYVTPADATKPGAFLAAAQAKTHTLSPNMYGLALGHLGADAQLDVVIPDITSGTLNVYLGQGDGTFVDGTPQPLGLVGSVDAALVDLDGDTVADLVTATYTIPAHLQFAKGNADRSFGTPVSYDLIGNYAYSLAVGRLDGDTYPDVAVAYGDAVAVLLNKQDGSFETPVQYLMGTNVVWVVVADLNHDGVLDLISANLGSSGIAIRLGKGDGSFLALDTHPVGVAPSSVAVLDVNQDGNPDVAGTDQQTGRLFVLLGDGTGGLGKPIYFVVGVAPAFARSADLDGDGLPDLALLAVGDAATDIALNRSR